MKIYIQFIYPDTLLFSFCVNSLVVESELQTKLFSPHN